MRRTRSSCVAPGCQLASSGAANGVYPERCQTVGWAVLVGLSTLNLLRKVSCHTQCYKCLAHA